MAQASGARLIALESASESNFFKHLRCGQAKQHLSGWQDLSIVGGRWVWGSGEVLVFQSWSPGQPDGGGTATIDWSGPNGQCESLTWGDEVCATGNLPSSLFLEWSADCNNDGLVDYGQCLDGSLLDANSNNVPDCCESGTPCLPENMAIQWRIENGGNGHWYEAVRNDAFLTWSDAQILCNAKGGALASLGTQAENDWVFQTIVRDVRFWSYSGPFVVGPWIGGRGPSGNWRWDDGTAWSFAAWLPGEGPPSPDPVEQFAHYFAGMGPMVPVNAWGDYFDVLVTPSYLVEWSADCNSDGIVDYGQILQGQLADADANGIPDLCEAPTCTDADLTENGVVDGADLGALLAFWGPVGTVLPQADIDGDGQVNGADLGILLSFWGPCGG